MPAGVRGGPGRLEESEHAARMRRDRDRSEGVAVGLTEKLRERLKERNPGSSPATPRSAARPIKRAAAGSGRRPPGAGKGRERAGKGSEIDRRFLLGAAACAGLASLLAVSYLSQAGGRLVAAGSLVTVLVPTHDVAARIRLTADDVTQRRIPRSYLPHDVLMVPQEAVGKVALVPLEQGEVLMPGLLSDPGPATGIAPKLDPGERGFLLDGTDADSLALIKPDDHVDLIATVPEPGDSRLIPATVLQDVRVLSVGDRMSPDAPPSGNSTLTLAVPADKIGLLTVLKQQRILHVALRSLGDDTRTSSAISPSEVEQMVLGSLPTPTPIPQPVETPRVVIIHEPVYRTHPHPHHTQSPQEIEVITGGH